MSLVSELNNIADELVECHNTLKNNLVEKGVECSDANKLLDIINRISHIKSYSFAMGKATLSQNNANVTVTGLNFKPVLVIILCNFQYWTLSALHDDFGDFYMNGKCMYSDYGNTIYTDIDGSTLYMKQGAFRLKGISGRTNSQPVTYLAIGM